jgi:hypothetical protein
MPVWHSGAAGAPPRECDCVGRPGTRRASRTCGRCVSEHVFRTLSRWGPSASEDDLRVAWRRDDKNAAVRVVVNELLGFDHTAAR